jgi:AcrR family transcriptional regulator
VSIDDIASEAGVAKGLLYHYFGGKKTFYRACLELLADGLVDAIAVDPELSGPVRLAQGLAAYLDFVDARADAYLALMGGALGQDEDVAAVLERARVRIAGIILDAAGLGAPWPPAYRVAVRAWLGAVEAAALDQLRNRDLARDALVAALVSTLQALLASAHAVDPSARPA